MAERRPDAAGAAPRRPVLTLLAAWVFLNAFLMVDPWPAPGAPLHWLTPSAEVWGLLAVTALLARRLPWGPGLGAAWLALLIFLRLFRLADTLMPVYFNRPFNLYVDAGYLPGLLHLLAHSFPPAELAAIALAGAVFTAGGLWALGRALRAAHRALGEPAARRALAGLTALGLAAAAGGQLGWPLAERLPAPASVMPRLAEEIAFMGRVGAIRREGLAAVDLAAQRLPEHPDPLARLRGRDVHLFVVESYGQTLWVDPRLRAPFAVTAGAFGGRLAREGFHVVSAYLRSPTFGGASWLAFGTLETGVRLPDQLRFNYVVTSRATPLAEFFNRAGYRSVSVMPGTTMPWPEGDFFAYRKTYYARELGYRGPAFTWSPMPDQFALQRIHEAEILTRRQPLFLRYVLTSTHAPFNRLPPYLEDWSQVGDGSVFHRLAPRTFPVNWPDLSDATEAYLAAMAYEFRVLEGFLARAVEGKALVIVVGDHQPVAHIAGDQAPWLVPVHVISRDRGLLSRFEAQGYTPGMRPREAASPAGMEDFMGQLFAALGGEG